ncbi:MAG: hypothetical protein CL749_02030 [Chloroflexi bacterium]|nr:hypothetical protein [Chloroflexota bacterium]MQG02612.1 hypothetical protein [SAR202 cluster bacterium]PKB64256.1 MAG: hypothetical protein BZY82_11670 [SAR202 cluster bacterium Io17-Chloro-G3]
MVRSANAQYLLVDPTTSPVVPSFVAAPRLSDLKNKRIGLIDDSKENAKELLDIITDVIKEKFGVESVCYHRKPSASKPADPEVISNMTNECDFAIVAIGS